MRLLLLFGIIFYLHANPTNKCVSVENLSLDQQEIILYAYNYGKAYNLGYTLAAIAWHESCAGEYRLNIADPSAGIYHALIPTVLRRYKMLSDNGFNRNVIASLLINDDEFASKVAIDELMYWEKTRNGNWKDMIKSYNKGFLWEKSQKYNELAEKYYDNILTRRNILTRYIPSIINKVKIKERPPMLSNFNSPNAPSLNQQQLQVAQKIKVVETISLNKYDKKAIRDARNSNHAVISIYSKDGESVTHEKTIILRARTQQ